MTTTTSAGFRTAAGTRYEMPIVFGPSSVPQVSRWGYARAIDVSFVTTHDAIRPLVPVELEVPEEPVVSVSRRTFDQVDYLGGRGYEELTIGVRVSHPEGAEATPGTYWLVMWVDQVHPILAGREITGYPKLGGQLPPVDERDDAWTWELREFGTLLLSGSLSETTPVTGDALETVKRAAAVSTAYNSRYIPPVVGGDGVDQLTSSETGFAVTSYRRGTGTIAFEAPSRDDAPQSAAAMRVLSQLPIVRVRSGAMIEGHSWFDRSTVTALPRA